MELKWILLVMFILYVVPELLKRRKPKKYEYPEFPEAKPAEQPATVEHSPARTARTIIPSSFETRLHADTPAIVTAAPMQLIDIGTTNAWNGKLAQHEVINGLIYAEIMLPPRALRPIAHYHTARQGRPD